MAIAGQGIYSNSVIPEIERQYLEQYFIKSGDQITVIKKIREKIVFSNHNLFQDPPFIKMDLVTCRNLLIYFENRIQLKSLYNIQFGLNHGGFLFLGTSESLGDLSPLFETTNSKWKIFKNTSSASRRPSTPILVEKRELRTTTSFNNLKPSNQVVETLGYRYKKENDTYIYNRYLSKKYGPSVIFINNNFDILFINGDAGAFISHQEGVFQNNILKIVSPEIAALIRNGIKRVNSEEKDVVLKNIKSPRSDQDKFLFDITFHKVESEEIHDVYAIIFSKDKKIEKDESIVVNNIVIDELSQERLEDLEEELRQAKVDLQMVIQELETSNEELQSSNEELMASNEELQSTNEELQSVNEELYTVNSEVQLKNIELTDLYNDITNILDHTNIGMMLLDNNLCIRKFNNPIEEIFKLHKTDVGRPLAIFNSTFNRKQADDLLHQADKVIKTRERVEYQVTDELNNLYLVRISPFVIEQNLDKGVVITLDSLNTLREIEQVATQSENRYKALFENLDAAFFHAKIITDQNDQCVDWQFIATNSAFERVFEINNNDVEGKRISDLLKNSPEVYASDIDWLHLFNEVPCIKSKSREDQNNEDRKELMITKNNRQYLVRLFCPAPGEFGATLTDITSKINRTEELKNTKTELDRIQAITRVGSFKIELPSMETQWSDEMFTIVGKEIIRPIDSIKVASEILTPESYSKLENATTTLIQGGTAFEMELEGNLADGQTIYFICFAEPVLNEKGKTIAVRGAFQDITERKLIELQLIEERKKAEIANLHKNYFLANMSHEIRTPLNAIIGFSEMLKEKKLSEDEKENYLKIIDGNSHQLLNLIDDIIDVSKIESQELIINEEPCDISKLFSELEANFLKINKKETVALEFHQDESIKDLIINTDCIRIRQIVSNLLQNGLKFTDKGKVSCTVKATENKLKITIQDTGIGISKEKHQEIFERFKQINYEKNAKYGGTGLGLAIVNGIAKLLGGTIEIDSEIGKGATFTLQLPLHIVEGVISTESHNTPPEIIPETVTGTILFADDEYLVRLFFEKFLDDTNLKIIFAEDGRDAVTKYAQNPGIDMVFLDIRMPEVNGYDAAKEILEINPDAKIVFQSAFVMGEEKELAQQIGITDYVTKPLQKSALIKVISKYIPGVAAEQQ